MYKLLLCWRYLRTRWIALASIVSVTLGVATLIVVNSVMDGFTEEMQGRIHGILSDVVFESHSADGIRNPEKYQAEIQALCGDDVEGMTTVITLPAMLSFTNMYGTTTQQVNVIGIDDQTYASVSDFSQYLLHPKNRDSLSFELHEDGYAPDRQYAPHEGWAYRRMTARLKKEYEATKKRNEEIRQQIAQTNQQAMGDDSPADSSPASTPGMDGAAGPSVRAGNYTAAKKFDPEFDAHTGIVLGISIGSVRLRDENDEVVDKFFIKPGDDVSIGMPSAGSNPTVINANFTVVDYYESKMSEYDSTFAFVPLSRLQELRGMIDPLTQERAVTSIQLKLRDGADIDSVRDKLRAAYPAEYSLIHVNTWRDTQGPLLAAVQMETTILNILLFMIIAVAGFGILATFFMIVVEKTRDIGVLKSLGAPGSGIASIFLTYGLLLGAVGSGVGAVIGLIFVWKINDIARLIELITGREVFDPTVYYFESIPTIIHPFTIVWVVLGAMLIAVMASVLPSIRAARMHPVEALRYE
jgi:lipoprotein-releasing system permease protein